ncbi:MAG: hypothetical protein HOI86_12050 [Tateyamaria sp.]|jgi:hypothetical protein|nr:hypothetical protein [Tateyamaria sp.]MBT5303280.1 hypothetical protein [Tateyamaria sp.]MBT6268396.1 hypothetical protein [Tateyamaria sp.]MBT6341826.1 hypothetical protein [Tateyamaria sp.]MBT7448511.1 hypothetical protein [Tateyamaria sp.]
MSSNGKGDTLATETEHQLLELRLALETVKAERDRYKSTSKIFEKLLTKAEERAERSEERLHQITLTMSEISQSAIKTQKNSDVTEVLVDGRSLLRLNSPVGFASNSLPHRQ